MVEADLRGWLPVMGVMLTEDRIARVLEQAEDHLVLCETTDRKVQFPTTAHLVSATKPPV